MRKRSYTHNIKYISFVNLFLFLVVCSIFVYEAITICHFKFKHIWSKWFYIFIPDHPVVMSKEFFLDTDSTTQILENKNDHKFSFHKLNEPYIQTTYICIFSVTSVFELIGAEIIWWKYLSIILCGDFILLIWLYLNLVIPAQIRVNL